MQKRWAVVKDVTAERGEVAIEQCVSASTGTVDGNPAVASPLQGMAMARGMSGVLLRSRRVSERWSEGERGSGCSGTWRASTAHVDKFGHGRVFALAVDVFTSRPTGGVVRWR